MKKFFTVILLGPDEEHEIKIHKCYRIEDWHLLVKDLKKEMRKIKEVHKKYHEPLFSAIEEAGKHFENEDIRYWRIMAELFEIHISKHEHVE